MSAAPLILNYVSAAEEQAWNQASLADTVTGPELRFWAYREPGVVLGCSQRGWLDGEPDGREVELAVRAAGGGAVPVGSWMLSTSIALPTTHPFALLAPSTSYRWLGEAYAKVLQGAGIAAQAIDAEQVRVLQHSAPELSWACYGGLSPWEVVVGRRKVVGLAQVRRRTGVLFVAGLLFGPPDWALLCRVLGRPAEEAAQLAARTTCCMDEAGAELSPVAVLSELQSSLLEAVELPLERCQHWLPALEA
jgi:lipoate-protein ligase A